MFNAGHPPQQCRFLCVTWDKHRLKSVGGAGETVCWCHLELLTSYPHCGHSQWLLTAISDYVSFLRGHLLTGNRQKLYLASWLPEASGLARPTRCHLGGELQGSSPVMTPSPRTTRLPRATPPLHKPLTCHCWPPQVAM